MDIPSLKKSVIIGMYNGIKIDDLKNNSLILVTAAGVITGKPVSTEELQELCEKKKFKDMSDEQISLSITSVITNSTQKVYDEKYKVEHPTSGNDGYFLLKDVTFISHGVRCNLSSLVVFFDQIIGISAGSGLTFETSNV